MRLSEQNLSSDLPQICETVRSRMGNSSDLIIRELLHGPSGEIRVGYLYLDGLVDRDAVQEVAGKLSEQWNRWDGTFDPAHGWPSCLNITSGDAKPIQTEAQLFDALLMGETVLLLDGLPAARSVATIGGEHRVVGQPSSQTVIRGSQEGFNETFRSNTALVRRRVKDPNLWLETRQIGQKTKTSVGVMYINGLVKQEILQEIRQRLDKIKIDGILESGCIEELIQSKKFSLFPTMLNSERPDVVAAALLEGRIAIFVDGTPFVLLVPSLFLHFFQSAEDYYTRSNLGVFRMLRFVAFFLTLFTPSLYIAITTFHQEMIPTTLLISLAAQREGIPFPAFVEALIMEITFELLREGGIRMPRAVGSSITIVGALVLGDAAVQAGLVSPAMVIVVSVTAISSFLFPSFEIGITTRLLRFFMMGLAAVFGLFGIFVGAMALLLHLCSINSFGIPYMTPLAPLIVSDQKDSLVRLPWRLMKRRPLLWFITLYYKLTFYFYAVAVGLAQTLGLKEYRVLTYPLGVLCVILASLISPNPVYERFYIEKTWIFYIATSGLLWPLLLLSIAPFRKKQLAEEKTP